MRSPTLQQFEDEHEELQEQIALIEKWIREIRFDSSDEQRATIEKTVDFFERYLPPRMRWEESVLYPFADDTAPSHGVTATLRIEHNIASRRLARLADMAKIAQPDIAAFQMEAYKLLGLLDAHFEAEEALLTPLLPRDDVAYEAPGSDPWYGFTVHLSGASVESARAAVVEELKAEGFGVLTEIDVAATLRDKLGVSFRPYRILGACNPQLAHRALQVELGVGLLLPCNVGIWHEEGGAVVSIAKPEAMSMISKNGAIQEVVEEADARLRRVMMRLTGGLTSTNHPDGLTTNTGIRAPRTTRSATDPGW